MRGTPEQSPLSEEHAPNRKSGAPADASSCAPRSAEAAHITRVLSDLLMWAGAEPVGFVTLRRPDQRAWLMLFVKRNPGPVPQEGIAVPGLPCGELPDHEYPPCATFATQMPLNRRRFSVPYSKRAHHLAQIIHTGGWLGLDGGWAAERLVILGSGYDGGPAGGPVTGGFHGPRGFSFRVAGLAFRWSGCVWQGGDPGPGAGYGLCPGPGGGDFQPPAAAAADQLPGRMEDPVTQGFRLGEVRLKKCTSSQV